MKRPLLVIAGPTACGKTDAAVQLAKRVNGEIISGDSMQIYRFMNIGTAKPTIEEMQGIPHYLIGEKNPDEEYNAVVFQTLAKQYLEQIYQKGKLPILVGGTGFYMDALVYDTQFAEMEEDREIRNNLEALAKEQGVYSLHEQLEKIDPVSAQTIHPNNSKRVIRAIAFYQQTGTPISSHNQMERQKESPYSLVYFILTRQRAELYQRIEQRVDQMLQLGLLQEVEGLLKRGYAPSLVSMQGLGYKELVPVIQNEAPLAAAVQELKQRTRHFAKRQMTWFRREKNSIMLDASDKTAEILGEEMQQYFYHIKGECR